MIAIDTWEIFFVGARTLIGLRRSGAYVRATGPAEMRDLVNPVFQLERALTPQGIQTIVYPVGWLPVQELALPDDVMSVPVASLGPQEVAGLARSVAKAEELLQQMRAAGSGIAVAREMPK